MNSETVLKLSIASRANKTSVIDCGPSRHKNANYLKIKILCQKKTIHQFKTKLTGYVSLISKMQNYL